MSFRFGTLIFILTSIFTLLVIYTISQSQFSSTIVKDITLMSFSFSTLIIALLLYDRFDYRKHLYKKKLDLVIDLLTELKSSSFHVKFDTTAGTHFAYFAIKRSSIKTLENLDFLKFPICFSDEYRSNYYKSIIPFLENPFLPKEILESLNFLNIGSTHSVNHETKFEERYVKLYLNKFGNFSDENLLWHAEIMPERTLQKYTLDFYNCLTVIEAWIDKHSNIKSELNI